MRYISVGRPAVGRVVLEAAVLRRVVRWCDDDAIGQSLLAAAVMDNNGARNNWRRGYPILALDNSLGEVGREHLKSGSLRRAGESVSILAQIEWAISALHAAEIADRLGDCQDMSFCERATQRRASMAARAEGNPLVAVGEVWLTFIVLPFEPRQVNQHLGGSRFAREG